MVLLFLLWSAHVMAQSVGGMSGIGLKIGGAGGNSGPPPPTCGAGALDLSTGCAQLVAFGVLF